MKYAIEAWEWIGANADALAIVVPILGAVGSALWAFLSYIDLKKREVREKQLQLYHDLVRKLVSPPAGSNMKLDSQIAIVYELTNFPDYFPLTARILEGLRREWIEPRHERLIEEMDLALDLIRKKNKK